MKKSKKENDIKRAIDGDKKAFKKVIEKYNKQMYQFIFLHTKYEEDSLIILRDSILFMRDNITKLEGSQEFIEWMYRILTINTNNFLEANGMTIEESDKEDYYENDKITLYETIDSLEGKYKTAIILRYYFDFSYKSIAEILDLNINTVFIYIRQALKKMKVNVGESLNHE